MSVHVHLIGRFGNNLFQIALGRIIAEKTGYQFSLAQENKDLRSTYGLPFDYLDTKFENQEHMPNCPSFIPGKIAEGEPVVINEHNYESVDQIIDFANGRPIILHGFFQRWKYYLPYREKLREWFLTGAVHTHPPRHMLLRVRHEDYPEEIRLHFDYYNRIIESGNLIGFDTFVFSGKDIRESLRVSTDDKVKMLRSDLSSIEVFKHGLGFNGIACANSSFDWWMAFLGNASRVLIPQPSNPKAYWSKESNQDLCAPIEGWELVPC